MTAHTTLLQAIPPRCSHGPWIRSWPRAWLKGVWAFVLPSLFVSLSTPVLAQESGGVRLLSRYIPSGGPHIAGSWGWTDPSTGREYALLGNPCGTAIVEITDPTSPVERDFIPGVCSLWREIQVHSHYAYVVSEDGGGVQIIDLSTLPDSAHLVKNFNYSEGNNNILRSHTIHIKDGFMYLNGCAYWQGSGFVIFSLVDPINPLFQSAFTSHYIHDCFVRNDTLFAAAIYGGGVFFVDVTIKTEPQQIAHLNYPGSGTHNCATTDDGKYLLTTDEIGNTPKTLKIWDVSNINSFSMAAEYIGDPQSIVHNVFVKGNIAYLSYYTAGLKVIDISEPSIPIEVGGYDTYGGPNGSMRGAWSTFPFFPSGNIIIGDRDAGLFVVTFDQNAPRPPTSVRAYSDYQTPTSIELTWIEPAVSYGGTELANYTIEIFRQGEHLATVGKDIRTFVDTDLTTHVLYEYSVRVQSEGGPSGLVPAQAYAGGHAEPRPPTQLLSSSGADGVNLSWRNPSSQLDGTPLNDLAFVEIFRDGLKVDSIIQGPNDTGQVRTHFVHASGLSYYNVRVRDNDTPINYSSLADSILEYAGVLGFSFLEDFEAGRGRGYRTGTWDTTSTIAFGGVSSLTDSPSGNYPENSSTYALTPPVIIQENSVLRFKHIATLPGGDYAFVDVSRFKAAHFTNLRVYNSLLHPEWYDGRADSGDWIAESISLAGFAGDTVAVRFLLASNGVTNGDGWYIDDVSVDIIVPVEKDNTAMPPEGYALDHNFPNPFNPSTSVSYSLPVTATVQLKVFDVLGREITTMVDEVLSPGYYVATWDTRNQSDRSPANGLYVIRLDAIGIDGSHFRATRKAVLLK